MDGRKTLIFQHLHRTGGTTADSILRRYVNAEAIHRIDLLRNGKKYSLEYFLSLPQKQRDRIELLRGHLPFGLHEHFSHPCEYVTIIRDPLSRIISEYSRLSAWKDRSHIKGFEKLEGMTFQDFVESDFAAVNDYQVRVLSGRWTGQYEEVAPLEADALEEAKHNLKKYFKIVGVTDRFDETMLVLAKAFGLRHPYYLEKKQVGTVRVDSASGCETIIAGKNKLDAELYRFAGLFLDKLISEYGSGFSRDLRKFKLINRGLSVLYRIGCSLPPFVKKPVKEAMQVGNYENLLP